METEGDRRGLGRPRRGRERLTRERILRATLRVVDEDGMGALSIRRLAAELGVDPMAIYHHLPGKEAGLSGMVEMVYGRCTRRPIPALRGKTSCARTRAPCENSRRRIRPSSCTSFRTRGPGQWRP